jgi:ribonuclease P protein component
LIGRVRDRRLFDTLRASGRTIRQGSLTVSYVPLAEAGPGPLVAFALGRRFGTAVQRNRARRRVRAAFAEAASALGRPFPYAFLVRARPSVLDDPFPRLVADVAVVLRKACGCRP